MSLSAERSRTDRASIVSQIDDILGETSDGVPIHLIRRSEPVGDAIWFEKITRYASALERLAPPRSTYRRMGEDVLSLHMPPENSQQTAERLRAVLLALREDLTERRLERAEELIHADILTDFLDMAQRLLLIDGFKEPAAVVAGSVMAEHLRRLSGKNGIGLLTEHEGETIPKRASQMMNDLVGAEALDISDARNLAMWNQTRIHSLEGRHAQYTREEVVFMISGLRDLIARYPA